MREMGNLIDLDQAVFVIGGSNFRLVRIRDSPGITIAKLLRRFKQHAKIYYRHPDGSPTSEISNFTSVIRVTLRLYGPRPALLFGCKSLKRVRRKMIRLGWSRKTINKQVVRIRMIFKWAAEEEILPAAIYQALATVAPLKRGRSAAAETPAVKPVKLEIVHRTLGCAPPMVGDIARLQLLSSARPSEILAMRVSEIDQNGAVWTFTPGRHKKSFREHQRVLYFGPKAQTILRPYLRRIGDDDRFVFSPIESERQRREALHGKRVTAEGRGNSIGTNRVKIAHRRPGHRYGRDSYYRAIQRAITLAFQPEDLRLAKRRDESVRAWKRRLTPSQRRVIEKFQKPFRWFPYQLRHTRATQVRKSHGAEAVGPILGDKSTRMVDIYAEKDEALAMTVAAETG